MNIINIYQTSPNQKCVMTHKTLSDETHLYGKSNIEATLLAARSLSDRAYKLYSRMNLHQDQYAYALSPTEIHNSIGMSEKRYREAVKELIAKGYLVQSKSRKNLYEFFELPDALAEVLQQESIQAGDIAPMDGWQNDRTVAGMDAAVPEMDATVTELADQPGESGSMSQPIAWGTPAGSGREILQDTTSNITRNTTINTTNNTTTHLMPYSAKRMEYIRKKEESYLKCLELQARMRKEIEEQEKKEQEERQEHLDMAEEIDDLNAELGDAWACYDELPF